MEDGTRLWAFIAQGEFMYAMEVFAKNVRARQQTFALTRPWAKAACCIRAGLKKSQPTEKGELLARKRSDLPAIYAVSEEVNVASRSSICTRSWPFPSIIVRYLRTNVDSPRLFLFRRIITRMGSSSQATEG